MNITPAREFAARRLASERLIGEGKRAQKNGSRLAAKLYKAGKSVDAAAREAAFSVRLATQPSGRPAA